MSTCEICSNPFVPVRSTSGRFCSPKCYRDSEPRGTARERFDAKINKTENGCWIWTGYKTKRGHGMFSFNGRRMVASRAAWIMFRGPIIDDDLLACHNCPGGDNPSCVNPDHLFLGTQKQNMDDASKKGRLSVVRRNPRSHVSDDDIRAIRRRYETETATAIAPDFDISETAVQAIATRISFPNVV